MASDRGISSGPLLPFPVPEQTPLVDDQPAASNGNMAGVREEMTDAEARASALQVDRSWIVEAPAGSGKTGLLVQRYLKLLGSDSVDQPEDVLAITFTRKATAELRERVLHELEAARLPAPASLSAFDAQSRELAAKVLQRDTTAGWGLIEKPARLRIRTIDALCVEIASALPLQSGSGAGLTPVDNAEALHREAARRTLLGLGGPDATLHEALRVVLLHRDGSLDNCERLLARMLATREQWGELVPLGEELEDAALEEIVRPRLEKALGQVICEELTAASEALPPDLIRTLASLAAHQAPLPGHRGAESPIAICAGKHEPPGITPGELAHWKALVDLVLTSSEGEWRTGFGAHHLKFQIDDAAKKSLADLVDTVRHNTDVRDRLRAVRALPSPRYPDEQWKIARALFVLLVRGLAELKVLFADRGQCDFTEFSLAAKQALRSDEGSDDLAATPGARLKHLLVDEMQDTSSQQYDLIELLTRRWDGFGQTLFLVGDPKQSIYMFRQARVERFLRTMREARIGDIPLGVLRLKANFRSQARLVSDLNDTFSLVFPSPQHTNPREPEAVDVPFTQAEATRAAADTGLEWHPAVLCADDQDADSHRQSPEQQRALHEAKEIRRIVETWRARPLPAGRRRPWKIAVLARARHHLRPVLAEFQRKDADGSSIPFRALDVEPLGEQAEVLDTIALTRALLHPADRIAWLSLLRAPWCGLGLGDLLTLAGDSASKPRYEAIPQIVDLRAESLSPDGRKALQRVRIVLNSALEMRGRLPVAELVERTWRSLGGDIGAGPQGVINVQRYLSVLREVEQPGGIVDLSLLTERVQQLFASPGSTSEDAVDLLTMHGAKGLEWDVVCIPALERKDQQTSAELLNWLEVETSSDEGTRVVLAPIGGRGDQADPLYEWLRMVRSKREKAERKRVFYVSCTRAREELHLFGAAKRSLDGTLQRPAQSLLESAWNAAEPIFKGVPPVPGKNLLAFPSAAVDMQSRTVAALAAGAADKPSRVVSRLPATFDPAARFADAARKALPYPQAAHLQKAEPLARPAGSFEVRAFGNVVHRYLQRLGDLLQQGISAATLLEELPRWDRRLRASLRAEGLPPHLPERFVTDALEALRGTLEDPIGRWILEPRQGTASEWSVQSSTNGELRVDRVFRAGYAPGSDGDTHYWIVDFKTTDPGAKTPAAFESEERTKYSEQMEIYASTLRRIRPAGLPVMLGLFYPAARRMLWWKSNDLTR